ncbi:MAG: PAS domain S-box protein [Proteobacteria bacterium]|nr:PAS domain S-box protein [Desulfobacula sp.]MBU3952121.1 PAS domain S-box protein [Pseudomonadota bacterium]MBU4129707.1 PAS domain S-box protein [Pseudomonadota bacterium]
MAGKIAFYQQIVESMDEGVMALDKKGRITLFNEAAARILGMAPDTVLDKPFGQIFMMEMEGNDEFSQTILDAVYESAVGLTSTVEFKRQDGGIRVISMATSYLKVMGENSAPEDGIVVVLNDITDITQSREKEKDLTRQITEAFLQVEETNKNLETALKKMKGVRFFILVAVILGLAGTCGWLWYRGDLSTTLFSEERLSGSGEMPGMNQVAVMVRPLSSSISLSGSVAPFEEVNVTAPFDGKVMEKYFVYDQKVEKGAALIKMDTAKLEVELRDAKAAHIKADLRVKELTAWEKSPEVSNAKRSLTKARNSLDTSKRKLEESRVLFEKGIISRSEFESSENEYVNQQMDFTASEEALESILDKGNKINVEIGRMELANARVNMEEIEEKLTRTIVHAPVSGIVIKPATEGGTGQGGSKTVEPGLSVSQGEVLLTVGNLDGLSVKTRVDEIDIGKIRFKQKVKVVGDAFSDIPLTGYVRHISSNAESEGMEGPMFGVTVAIEKLSAAHREEIRLGMSTNLEIMVYDNPEALVIPLGAVELRGDKAFVRLMDDGGIPVERKVVTGITTLDSVEILQGLAPGDVVYSPGREPFVPDGEGLPSFGDR